MNNQKLLTRVVGLVFILSIFSCNPDEEFPVTSFYSESFGDLNSNELLSMETPFEAVFGDAANIGGRTEEGFADLLELIEKLATIFPNVDILGVEVEEHRGVTVWNFKVKMESGGIVKFKFVQEVGKIIKIKGKTGPYDYEIDPGGNFIPFSRAKELALDAVGGGEVKAWSLELEEENRWEYEFHIVFGDKRYEVEINGFGEEVISIRLKGDDQDEDNDGEDEGDDEDDDGKDDEENIDVPDDVVLFAKEIFNGELKHGEKHKEGDHIIWKIYLVNSSRAVVEFLIWDEPVALENIEGERGPFDYEVEPGGDVLSLQTLLEDVFRETEGGELVEWELEKEYVNDQEFTWIYEFKVVRDNIRYEIEMNAYTGEFLEFVVID